MRRLIGVHFVLFGINASYVNNGSHKRFLGARRLKVSHYRFFPWDCLLSQVQRLLIFHLAWDVVYVRLPNYSMGKPLSSLLGTFTEVFLTRQVFSYLLLNVYPAALSTILATQQLIWKFTIIKKCCKLPSYIFHSFDSFIHYWYIA